jgi:predicted nucleic acid-binding protein
MPDAGIAVVDASVALKWQLDDEECVTQATALRNDFYARGIVTLIAPALLIYETANGIVTAARHKRISRDKAIEAMRNIMAFNIEFRAVAPADIPSLALKYNLTAYDATYLALAEQENCDLWTGDKAFFQAVSSQKTRVKWIEDYGKSE